MSPLISNAITSGFSAIPLDLAATNGAAAPTKSNAKAAGQAGAQTALFKQIQQSVLGALQSADNNDSDADPNDIVQQAIANVLRQNGSSPLATNSTSGTGPQSAHEFFQTLQQYGITPDDFKSDYAAALKSSQNGLSPTAAPTTAAPLGSLIDITF